MKMVDTSKRSMPKSEVEQANLIGGGAYRIGAVRLLEANLASLEARDSPGGVYT